MRSKTTLSITEARKKIFDIAEEVQRLGKHYTLTENGRPKVVVMSADEFESWAETLEVLSDPGAMARIEKSQKEFDRGEYTSWQEVKKKFLHHTAEKGFMVADAPRKKYSVKKKKK